MIECRSDNQIFQHRKLTNTSTAVLTSPQDLNDDEQVWHDATGDEDRRDDDVEVPIAAHQRRRRHVQTSVDVIKISPVSGIVHRCLLENKFHSNDFLGLKCVEVEKQRLSDFSPNKW